MGWIDCSGDEWRYEHEGFLVAVERERGSGVWRELDYSDRERGRIDLTHIQVGCECGWRSPRMSAPAGSFWSPCCATLPSERYDDAACKVWRQHVEAVAGHDGQLSLRSYQIASR